MRYHNLFIPRSIDTSVNCNCARRLERSRRRFPVRVVTVTDSLPHRILKSLDPHSAALYPQSLLGTLTIYLNVCMYYSH